MYMFTITIYSKRIRFLILNSSFIWGTIKLGVS